MIDSSVTPGIGLSRLWNPNDSVRPGPRPRITLEAITAAAMSIARSHGIAGVSMPEIASILGCSKMALYRHITDKGDLISAMLDAAFSETPPVEREPFDWQTQFTEAWDALVAIYTREIWIVDLPSDTNILTPNHLRWLEASLAMLSRSPLAATEQLSLMYFVSDAAKWEALRRVKAPNAGHQFDLLVSDNDDVLTPVVTSERFPHLVAAAAEAGAHPHNEDTFMFDLIRGAVGRHFADSPAA